MKAAATSWLLWGYRTRRNISMPCDKSFLDSGRFNVKVETPPVSNRGTNEVPVIAISGPCCSQAEGMLRLPSRGRTYITNTEMG